MDFELPPSFPSSGISWERVLAPLLPGPRGTLGPYSWSPSDLIIPATEPSGSARVVCDQSGFTVQMDVKHFSPEELVVKVTGHFVEVHGKHEQRKVCLHYIELIFYYSCSCPSLFGLNFILDLKQRIIVKFKTI
ncbi:hypothetical protein Z043_125396 [Scleropages formosus]|uniref:SHSP domain-containing protein n=1 Tax=Scleropages formosus TaxID=113540 RepID=A0A0P7UB48_SCLFO|nr:hypothetical protein Z043_125396 [Scleropages formosus]